MKERLVKAKHRQFELELELQRQGTVNADVVSRMESVKNTVKAMSNLE